MFEPLTSAPNPIPLHAFLAMAALVIGAVQFALPKGTTLHRSLGYIWVPAMIVIALSSFFINEYRLVGPFSPIHLLSVLVLYSSVRGVLYARAGRIRGHKLTMIQLYGFGLVLAGAFTFLPGRIMHQVVFGS